MNINNDYSSIYGFYNTLFQNTMSLYNNKLSKMFNPVNNAQSGGALSTGAVQYASTLKSASGKISSALEGLTGSAWNRKSMASSNEEIMSVKYSGNKSAEIKPMSVKIDQIAAGQTNEGDKLKSDSKFAGTGTNKFSIEIDGKTTEFSVYASSNDTNKDVQQKMADAINSAGIGVKASIVVDSYNNTSSLKIESDGIGDDAKNKFTIKDTGGSAVAKTGADKITQSAQNAVYSVDGGESKTSKSNTVDLGNGITATFNKASSEAVTISAGIDKDNIKSLIRDLANGFNELYDAAAENAFTDPKAEKLLTKLAETVNKYSASLSEIGINIDVDGRMSLNGDMLNKALDSGKAEEFFKANSGKNYGFTNQMSRLAGDITRNASNYVSKSAIGDSLTQNFSYSSYGDLLQYNYLSAGSIFDYSF